MLNNLETSDIVARITRLITTATGGLVAAEESMQMLKKAHSLISVLEKDRRPFMDFARDYPELVFVENETLPNSITAGREVVRAEAVDFVLRLQADGLDHFRLYYGRFGDYIEQTRHTPESAALLRMLQDYGHDWKVWRATNDSYNFVRKNREEEDLANRLATGMVDDCKERWPWAWIVVRVPIIVAEGEPPREAKESRR